MNYWVVNDGEHWAVKPERGAVVSRHRTQLEAKDAARALVRASGGGELIVQGTDGQIVSKDTIAKPDRFPPRG